MTDISIDNRLFLDNDLDIALQEIDMLLNTENTELIGNISYGTRFDQFLWTLTPTTIELEKYVKEQINEFCPSVSKFKLYVQVKFIEGEIRSIYYVKIILVDSSGNKGIREYQYQ